MSFPPTRISYTLPLQLILKSHHSSFSLISSSAGSCTAITTGEISPFSSSRAGDDDGVAGEGSDADENDDEDESPSVAAPSGRAWNSFGFFESPGVMPCCTSGTASTVDEGVSSDILQDEVRDQQDAEVYERSWYARRFDSGGVMGDGERRVQGWEMTMGEVSRPRPDPTRGNK